MNKIHNSLYWAGYIRKGFVPQVQCLRDTIFSRLLPAFDSIEVEAEKYKETVRIRLEESAREDTDPASLYEQLEDEAVSHYLMLEASKQGFLNIYATAIHHLFEQQLIVLLRKELLSKTEENDHRKLSFNELIKRLSQRGVEAEKYKCYPKILELRLVANVIKHAEGPSLEKLKESRPDLGTPEILKHDSPVYPSALSFVFTPLAGDDIYVSLNDLRNYLEAVDSFWDMLAEDLETL